MSRDKHKMFLEEGMGNAPQAAAMVGQMCNLGNSGACLARRVHRNLAVRVQQQNFSCDSLFFTTGRKSIAGGEVLATGITAYVTELRLYQSISMDIGQQVFSVWV
jgi:hypothetical protein